MNPPDSSPRPDVRTIDRAIADLESLIVDHSKSSRRIATFLMAGFALLISLAAGLYWYETQLAVGTLTEFERVAQSLQKLASKAKEPTEYVETTQAITDIRTKLTALVTRQQATGVQNHTLLIVGAGVFSLVFGLLMAVYRHHLLEISKLQHYKTAFTRIRVATDSDRSAEHSVLIHAALLERAFEYRSGKEKHVESPAPGHPLADASTMLLNKLIEEVKITRRP